ncbi:hypothetical protein G7Y89_g12304 [Cudoniella acicularis]|uniref:Uncharacterized protein n=1 Tax=Cudoniella acicularis TaxID=354080 RepID=A0A8H4VZA6_9HELO|nr:hypothetical protein G7Y89_g12304 [Cudoniella acicularis]
MDSRTFPLSEGTKRVLLTTMLGLQSKEFVDDSYFAYYQRLVEGSRANSLKSCHREIANLVVPFRQPAATRREIEELLRLRLSNSELEDVEGIFDDAVNLAVRLLLMMRTGNIVTSGSLITLSRETKVDWKEGTIVEFVKRHFVHQNAIDERVKFERIFNARNLERIGGVEVRWTCNLADHLRMLDDDQAVEIFHYASFLRLHEKSPILPPALIDETLRTLALLLPEHDHEVEKWFCTHQTKLQKRGKLPLDATARECGQLKVEERQIDNFEYWHDRLVILKQVFDEAEPNSVRQWWCDRRKRVQWYTFWVAAIVLALTIVFGLVQCVEAVQRRPGRYRESNNLVRICLDTSQIAQHRPAEQKIYWQTSHDGIQDRALHTGVPIAQLRNFKRNGPKTFEGLTNGAI